jgi:hypothetical protein
LASLIAGLIIGFFFIAYQTFITRMRVQSQHGDTRFINPEIFLQAAVYDLQFA